MKNKNRIIKNSLFYFTLCVLHSALFLAVIFISALAVSAQNKFFVRISAETSIENDRIELGKIAEIKGDEKSVEKLQKISLGYAPNVGMLREIPREKIILAIAAAGFSANEIALEAPPKIIVRRTAQNLDEKILRAAVENAVAAELQTEGVMFNIARLELPAKIEIPAGNFAVRAVLGNAQNMFAPFSVALEIRVNEKLVRRVSAMLEIEAFADVLVTNKDLVSGKKLTAEDTKIENRRITKPLKTYLRNPELLRGLNLTKNLTTGEEITTDSTVSAAVIKTGDAVQIEAVSDKLKIVISGEARTNGKIGDRISVKNAQSGAILQALVLDEKTVRVNF